MTLLPKRTFFLLPLLLLLALAGWLWAMPWPGWLALGLAAGAVLLAWLVAAIRYFSFKRITLGQTDVCIARTRLKRSALSRVQLTVPEASKPSKLTLYFYAHPCVRVSLQHYSTNPEALRQYLLEHNYPVEEQVV